MRLCLIIISVALSLTGALLFQPARGTADSDPLLIIVNNKVPVTALSQAEVKQIFLKQRQNWSSGGKMVPMNAKPGSPARAAFQNKILGMDENGEKAYWQEQKIMTGLTPPAEISNVPKAVFTVERSIGYCLKSQHKSGTSRVVLTL